MTSEEKGLIQRYNLRFWRNNSKHVKAIHLIERRDRFVYPTNADYISAAVLAFEGEFQFCPFEGNKEDEFIDKLVGRLEDWRNSRRYGG